MNLLFRLLAKNTSPTRIAGFILSNFIGLVIIVGSIFFYEDAGTIWRDDDSFMKNDWLVINRKVSSASLLEGSSPAFTAAEINDLKGQPWVRDVGEFSSADYRVWASVESGGRGMSTMLFFESVPDEFVDAASGDWTFIPESGTVPVILSKDYLTLYNFGFAGSAGLPQMSESVMEGIPLRLTLSSEDGSVTRRLDARIVGFSNRLNTILVPQAFMDWSNSLLGRSEKGGVRSEKGNPSRLIIDVSSPGDVAITEYLESHGLEAAGDKSSSSAAYLLKVVTGIVISVGAVITLLSFFILLLSMSLLMEKNRDKLHSLLMLGYPVKDVARPYIIIVLLSTAAAFGLAVGASYLLRMMYLKPLEALGATSGGEWIALLCGGGITLLIMLFNFLAIRRRVHRSF